MERGGRANLSVFNFNGNNKLKKFHKKKHFCSSKKKKSIWGQKI